MATQLPPPAVLVAAAKMSMAEDKPIYLDYYSDSLEKKCCIAVQPDNSKMLLKSESEYTSTIQSAAKCESCLIVATENSLYIVSATIPAKKIVSSSQ
jgi:hypothetical protein